MKKSLLRVFLGLSFCGLGFAGEKVQQVKEGNFALATSQQPGPLFSFGQNIVDKHNALGFGQLDYMRGDNSSYTTVMPQLIYGIRDNVSLFALFPVAARFKEKGHTISDCGDLVLQLEYAPYFIELERETIQITLVGNLTLPTGSADIVPETGFGAPGFFIGATASYIAVDWYVFASSGGQLTTTHNGTKFGNQFLYQAAVGRNLHHMQKWILLGLLEFNGIYTGRDVRNGCIDCNSGGNIFYIAPSLFLSSEHLICQVGFAGIVGQHLFGCQDPLRYRVDFLIGWKFN